MIVLYAVVPHDAVVTADAAEANGLKTFAGERVDVLYEIRDAAPGRNVDDVLAFGRKLQRIAETGPVLPVRYGSVVADIAELDDLMRAREASWAERLDRVTGQCELIVHLRLPEERTPSQPSERTESGTEYLRRRAAHLHAREAVLTGLLQTVGPSLTAHRSLTATDEERVALLVPAGEAGRVRRVVEEWGDSAALAAKVTGPWPPFSFCEEAGS